MKRSCVVLLTLAALAGCGGTTSTPTETQAAATTSGHESNAAFSQMTIEQVAAGLAQGPGALAVFDANSPATYAEHHVPTATWVDYDGVTAEQLPADLAVPVVFYCANEHCGASHTAAEMAIGLGHSNVSVMGAGIQGWVDAGQPVESATP